VHQFVEKEAVAAHATCDLVGLLDLREDLSLADDHGVQSGGDPEQVPDGGLVVIDVEDVMGERLRAAPFEEPVYHAQGQRGGLVGGQHFMSQE